MTTRIIMWRLKLLDTKCCTSKVLQAGALLLARLISWLGTAGTVDCFNKSVSDCYIRVYLSFWQGTANFWLGLLLTMPLKRGTQLILKISVYLCDHTRQLEYSKLLNKLAYYRFVFTSAPFALTKQTSSKLLPKN